MLSQQEFVKHTKGQALTTETGRPIGMALKLERIEARITLTDMAAALGISAGHLSHIEAGRRTASDDLVVRYRLVVHGRRLAA
jgi:plasmid maintenance system antidote protein VapI